MDRPHYTFWEDAQGLIVSIILCALGIHLLRTSGLVTSGTAGLALLISYIGNWSFGWVFVLINLPFYAFAWMRRGAMFTIKGFMAVLLVSILADAMPHVIDIDWIAPWAAAILFGVTTGFGLLGLFRHGASLGGISIVAVILQDRYGIRAGLTLQIYDACLFATSLFFLPWRLVMWSLLGGVLVNMVIAINHRRDWYLPQ